MLLEKQKTMLQDTCPLECTAELPTVLPVAFDVPLVTCVALPIVVTTPFFSLFAPVEAAVHKQDSVVGTQSYLPTARAVSPAEDLVRELPPAPGTGLLATIYVAKAGLCVVRAVVAFE
jgi:hypothetical protein